QTIALPAAVQTANKADRAGPVTRVAYNARRQTWMLENSKGVTVNNKKVVQKQLAHGDVVTLNGKRYLFTQTV
ncbi:MAG TPA: hypothetical protein VKS21_04000, partial [Spirochaetota bacterium]|nr:hypothetical protein [Spirochaetota bacterium]